MRLEPPKLVEMSEVPDFAEALAIAELEDVESGEIPLFNRASVAAALVDPAGAVVCASEAFRAVGGERHVDAALVSDVARGAGPLTTAVDLGADGDTAIFAYGLAARTGGWRLPPVLHEAVRTRPGHVVVLTSQAAAAARPLEEACRTYGLSGLQTRVVMETVRTGNVRTAARALGVTYHTAREAMSEAMRRARAPGLPGLVARLTSLAFGVLPRADAAQVLGDLWGLTPRQAAVAALIASGASRAATARALGVGEAVARKELEVVYLVLQVGSAAALARKVIEADALRWLTNATGGDIGFVDTSVEPLKFVGRPDGSRIAISDYGPPRGKPVLVVHSSTTSRIVSRRLLRALQAAGYRPIAIDRPGFGLTDEIEGLAAGAHDPFAAAARDAVLVLDHLKIHQTDLVSRGAAQFALALERAAPGRIRRAVIVNPDPHSREARRREGRTAAGKELFRRNPAVIRLLARVLIRGVTYDHVAQELARNVEGSPADERAVRDPELVRDYFHALRTFATGRIEGFINEQTYFATAGWPEPLPGAADWRVLVGGDDFMHEPEQVAAYWRIVLPDTPVSVVPGSGRFLAISQPDLVVDALVG